MSLVPSQQPQTVSLSLGTMPLKNQRVSSQSEEITCGCLPALQAVPQTVWCDHAGVLVFAPSLLAIAQVLDPPEARFTQWLASLLLGALNIEQTKFLNW